jgi:3-oxoacyl-[acyl-carrier-protein] synthase I
VKTRAVVVGAGARTPIGLDAQATGFLYRASCIVMQEGPLLDPDGEPVTICALPTLDPRVTGMTRLLDLALPVLDETLAQIGSACTRLRAKLLLCLDEAFGARGVANELSSTAARRAGAHFAEVTVSLCARGPAALGMVLDDALGEIERNQVDVLVVLGAHTDYDKDRVAALAAACRLFRPDRLEALIPGECAACVVIVKPALARARELSARVRLHATGTGWEKARPDNDESAFAATGLTAALRKVGETLSEDGLRAGWLLTDLTSEPFRYYEFSAALARTQRYLCEPQHADSPAQRLGYLGAAAMPLHLVLAAQAYRHGWAPHPIAISLAGSDAGERATLLLSAP